MGYDNGSGFAPAIEFDGVRVFHGDCREVLKGLPDNSVDSIVTDPPYGLSNTTPELVSKTIVRWVSGDRDFIPTGAGFMGKEWDSFVPPPAVWDECLRVLKPGGHLLAFFGSRTMDLGQLAIRLAGFELRDSIAWLYGSGFPKSLDVSKAIDKKLGAERELIVELSEDLFGLHENPKIVTRTGKEAGTYGAMTGVSPQTHAATPEAEKWQGWGTALKPAFEPVVVGRKPLTGTVAENVLEWGVGGLNIDGSRIGSRENEPQVRPAPTKAEGWGMGGEGKEGWATTLGRWPANVMLDEYTAELLDQQSGVSVSKVARRGMQISGQAGGLAGENPNYNPDTNTVRGHNDSGGASRFFFVADTLTHSRIESCENINANNVAKLLNTIRAIIESSAQTNVEDSLNESNAHAVKNAGIQCDSCATHIAADLVALKTLASNEETSTHFHRSINDFGNSILNQNLVSFVEKWVSTDTIPTTTDFSTLFGCALLAIDAPTKLENLENDNGRSRFIYQAKASKRDRNEGLDGLEARIGENGNKWTDQDYRRGDDKPVTARKNFHPTVKPTQLMRYLIKLVTPPGGTVLDPFTGSGSTGKAAILDGFEFVGAELTEDYLPIIEGRLKWALENREMDETLF